MAAIDGVLAHVLGRDDILITSRNIYGGAHQLIHDWYAKPGNLEIAVETFDGYGGEDFAEVLAARARRSTPIGSPRGGTLMSISSRPAIRTATFSICRAFAGEPTRRACA